MKVTLAELRKETRRVFGEHVTVFERHGKYLSASIVVQRLVRSGGYPWQHLDVAGKTRMDARRNALAILKAMKPVDIWQPAKVHSGP